jgi:thymidine kinase
MYASKTSEVIRRLIIYHDIGKKVLYLNTTLDTRSEEPFSTHNETIGKVPFHALKTKTLSEQNITNYDVIAIDEAQFFSDLKSCVLRWVDVDKKIVIVAGLNGDYRREQFGQINDLIPHADFITKLTPFCLGCVKQQKMRTAHFTKRIVCKEGETENILIGGKEAYIPVCRECYLN